MKKTCKGCYAAETGTHPLCGEPHGCSLGYQTNLQGLPLEECPKPKSWKTLERCNRKNVRTEEEV